MPPLRKRLNLADPITEHLHQEYTRLFADQTVAEALDWLRHHPPPGRISYFYVVDRDGKLQGVVTTRRLVLSPPEKPLAELIGGEVIALPANVTVREACDYFIRHRLLAFPVVDTDRRLLGIVDIELFTDDMGRLSEITPVQRWVRPLVHFLEIQSSSGIVLLICLVAALVLANSSLAGAFASIWQTPLRIGVGDFELQKPLLLWINDGLMAIFFFVVGLEIKREMVAGELREFRKAALPIVAALGGMIAPALVYAAFRFEGQARAGWGIPMATDIAFVVGFLALLGPRVPIGLKVLLLSLAIADDIGAALVIALVYNADVSPGTLLIAAAGFALVIGFRCIGVRRIGVYVVLGVAIWFAFLKSGIHPTVAGVLLGLLTPARPWLGDRVSLDVIADMGRRFAGDPSGTRLASHEARSPLERLETSLHPWVAFAIMPIFALANSGVVLQGAALFHPVALAVAAGLIVGKPLGIFALSWLAVRTGLARLPDGINWKILLGAGCLAGIGFTMSLFIASLALSGVLLEDAKIGILSGSAVSAVLGLSLLYRFLPHREKSVEVTVDQVRP